MYKIYKDQENFCSFVFNDTMGFEKLPDSGVHVEDIKLALRGHVGDGYQVQSSELWHGLKEPCGVFLLNKHNVDVHSVSHTRNFVCVCVWPFFFEEQIIEWNKCIHFLIKCYFKNNNNKKKYCIVKSCVKQSSVMVCHLDAV